MIPPAQAVPRVHFRRAPPLAPTKAVSELPAATALPVRREMRTGCSQTEMMATKRTAQIVRVQRTELPVRLAQTERQILGVPTMAKWFFGGRAGEEFHSRFESLAMRAILMAVPDFRAAIFPVLAETNTSRRPLESWGPR